MIVLEVRDLKKQFRDKKQELVAVNQVSFQIAQGECLALVGESGCGKSTTANMIARLLKETSGDIIFQGKNLCKTRRLSCVGKDLQMVFQNPQDSFDPRYTVKQCLMQGAVNFQVEPRPILEQKAREWMAYVGLKDSYFEKPIHALSGGECQRVAIARALICEPQLILFDEAASALDISMQAQIVELLLKLKEEKKLSFLFITHDLALAASLCDQIAVMYAGYLVEQGIREEILENPMHPYTKRLLSCMLPVRVDPDYQIPDCRPVRESTKKGCPYYRYCTEGTGSCAEKCPELLEISDRKVRCLLFGKNSMKFA